MCNINGISAIKSFKGWIVILNLCVVSIELKLKEIGMVGLVEIRRRKGRVAKFLELQEPPGGTHLADRRHTSDVWHSDSRKTLFFVLFAKQEPPGGSIVPPGATFPTSGR